MYEKTKDFDSRSVLRGGFVTRRSQCEIHLIIYLLTLQVRALPLSLTQKPLLYFLARSFGPSSSS